MSGNSAKEICRQGSSVVEQGTHKPLVGSSTLPPGNLIANCRPVALDVGRSALGVEVFGLRRFAVRSN